MRSQSSTFQASQGVILMPYQMAALLTRTSTFLYLFKASSAIFLQSASFEISASIIATFTPLAWHSSMVPLALSRLVVVSNKSAPSSANLKAKALPSPRLAPVITATLFFKTGDLDASLYH